MSFVKLQKLQEIAIARSSLVGRHGKLHCVEPD
jgi:hypothetical protein